MQQQLPPPDRLAFDPAGRVCMIANGGDLSAPQLAQFLKTQGWSVVMLSFPSVPTFTTPDIPHIVLTDWSEAHLKRQLQSQLDSVDTRGAISAFIYLHPVSRSENFFPENETALVRHVFLLAKHLKAKLIEAPYSRFLTVTHLDGELGCSRQSRGSAIAGGLFGLVKALRWEWPTVFCRALDLSLAFSEDEVVRHIVDELQDPNRLVAEVGCGPQGRVTLVAEEA